MWARYHVITIHPAIENKYSCAHIYCVYDRSGKMDSCWSQINLRSFAPSLLPSLGGPVTAPDGSLNAIPISRRSGALL